MSSELRRRLFVMIDLHPAAQRTIGLVTSVADEQLGLRRHVPRRASVT